MGCERRYANVPFSLSFEILIAPVVRAIRGTNSNTRFIKLAAVRPNPSEPAISSLEDEINKRSKASTEKQIVYRINHLFFKDSFASFLIIRKILLISNLFYLVHYAFH